jgi:hypothetical protein
MPERKDLKNQIILDLIMIPIAVFMTFDYSSLILSGENSLRRKIVLVVWIISIIGWSVKLVLDLKKISKS